MKHCYHRKQQLKIKQTIILLPKSERASTNLHPGDERVNQIVYGFVTRNTEKGDEYIFTVALWALHFPVLQ